jgi:glycine betaine transporter
VLGLALPAVAALALWGLFDPSGLSGFALAVTGFVLERFGWAVLLLATASLLFCLWLGVSRHGRKRLGPSDATPEFGTASWIAMLFAAGMGTGLVVWGVAEPVTHAVAPPGGGGLSQESAATAMVLTYLHWGLHAWAIYALSALVIAWFAFREGQPMTVSAPLNGLGSSAPAKALRTAADSLGILAVVFGVAGTLAMGMLTVRSGLGGLGFPVDLEALPFISLALIGGIALVSAATALGQGIRILSDINIALALLLMLAVLALGSTSELLALFGRSVAAYFVGLPELSLRLAPFPGYAQWTRDWTLTYFLWWLAWGPFVGVFIARISRGRTIRAFLAGVVLVPAFASFLWFAVMGGSGLLQVLAEGADGMMAKAALAEPTAALGLLLGGFPAGWLLGGAALVLLVIFLITSLDSAAYVLGMMSSGGTPTPAVWLRLIWGALLLALAAAVLSVATVEVARAMAILGALAYPLVLLLQALMLGRALRSAERNGKG